MPANPNFAEEIKSSFAKQTIMGLIGAGLLFLVGITYVSTIWIYSYYLIMDKNYKFWPAMKLSFRLVHKRWWMTWLLLLVGGIIGGLGVLVCCVGTVVTLPLYLSMIAWLYQDNFGDLAQAPEGSQAFPTP